MQRNANKLGTSTIILMLLAVITMSSAGCVGRSWSPQHQPTSPPRMTVVRAGVVESRHPPLAALIVRVARSDVDLDTAQTPEVDDLLRRSNEAIRPIEDARIVFLRTLARAVVDDHYSASSVALASQRVVIATEHALPALESILVDLHAALSPHQRNMLARHMMEVHVQAWAPTWRAPLTAARSTPHHQWIEGFAANAILNEEVLRAMREDAIFTARQWCSQTSQRVMESLPTMNAVERRSLSLELELDPDD